MNWSIYNTTKRKLLGPCDRYQETRAESLQQHKSAWTSINIFLKKKIPEIFIKYAIKKHNNKMWTS